MVSAGHVLLYNIQLFGVGKTEMKKAAITSVHVLVTLVGKGHLKLLLILVKFLFLLQSHAAEVLVRYWITRILGCCDNF